ncbi:MAG: hypothetical protein AUK48_09760 [Oscillatoriales cyanobacterium CG2_30_44_21]|nr:MAG: hypothetical protein AUK48_09760 [Oscillatoriales cyanobacterium CG2_30_44_21]
MVTVRVLRFADGKPVTATSVAISRYGSGFLDVGGVFRGEYTNREGEVRYSKLDLPAKGKVIVDGHELYDGSLEEFMTFKI